MGALRDLAVNGFPIVDVDVGVRLPVVDTFKSWVATEYGHLYSPTEVDHLIGMAERGDILDVARSIYAKQQQLEHYAV